MILPKLSTLKIEQECWNQGLKLVCGLDEVGRGSFAGPVVVGAVVFPEKVILPEGIKDSKLLTPKQRDKLSIAIKAQAVCWAVAKIGLDYINSVGIGKATQMAFNQAVKNLQVMPDFLLVDAFYIDQIDRGIQKAVKDGDKICASISAASIIAKVYRDALMVDLHTKYPQYNFARNKGYGTLEHRLALKKYGVCELHRKSFNLGKFL